VKKITVVSTSVIKSGTSDSGKAWTLYEVTAVNEDGAPIEEKLKSFDKLEGSVEVEVERQDDPKFGTSFMLKLPRAPSPGARLGPKVDEVRDRLQAVEGRVQVLEQLVRTLVERANESSGATLSAPTPAPTPTPAEPPAGAQF
jgi:hypothetical protein